MITFFLLDNSFISPIIIPVRINKIASTLKKKFRMNDVINKEKNKAFLFSGLDNLKIASIIRIIIAARIPSKANWIIDIDLNDTRKIDIMVIIINDGNITPKTAKNAPKNFPVLYPMKVAEFIAIGPGVDSATTIILFMSSSLIQWFFSTLSLCMREIMA